MAVDRLEQLDTLIEMTRLINSTLDPLVVRERAIEAAARLLDAEVASLLLIDQRGGGLFFDVATGEKGEQVKTLRVPRGLGVAGWVAETGQAAIVHDVQRDPRFYQQVDALTGFTTRDMVCVPVRVKDRTLGVLEVINRRAGAFAEDDAVVLRALANQVAIAFENAQLYQDAISDGLTGLYQRRYFDLRLRDEAERAGRYRHPLSVVLADVDDFGQLNERHGHQAGDRVLVAVASALTVDTRLGDVVCRHGGDEFALIIPMSPGSNVRRLAERLRQHVAGALVGDLRVTLSVGIAHFNGTADPPSAERMVATAGQALVRARQAGQNRVELLPA